jgi:hypothetical protein
VSISAPYYFEIMWFTGHDGGWVIVNLSTCC